MQAAELGKARAFVGDWFSSFLSSRQIGAEDESSAEEATPPKPQQDMTALKLLTFLCSEVEVLTMYARKKFYPVLSVAGDRIIRGPASLMGDSELQLAGLLPMLQDLLDFLEQMESLLSNLFVQLAATLSQDEPSMRGSVVRTCLRSIGKGLVVLLTIQTMVTLKILPLFFGYRRMLHTMMSKSNRVNADLNVLEEVQGQVMNQEESLRMGAFTNFIDVHVKRGAVGEVLRERRFGSTIESYVKSAIASIGPCLNGYKESYWDREDLLGVLLLFVTYCWGGSCPKDRKLLRVVLDVHQKSPILPLYCNLVVNPSRFLMDMLPSSMLPLIPFDYSNQALMQSSAHLAWIMSELDSYAETMSFRGSVWSMEVCAIVDGGIDDNNLKEFVGLVLEGFQLLFFVGRILRMVVQLHVEQLEPMSKKILSKVVNLICYQKLVAASIVKCRNHIHTHISDIQERQCLNMKDHLQSLQEVVDNLDKAARARRFHVGTRTQKYISRLDLCSMWIRTGLSALQESPGLPQRLILDFSIDGLNQLDVLPNWVNPTGHQILCEMEKAEGLMDALDDLSRCEYLYFHPELMRNAFQHIFTHPEEASKLQYLIDGFLDAKYLVEQAGFGSATRLLENEVNSLLRVHLIDPLSRRVETEVFATVKKGDVHSPHDMINGNLLPLLQLRPLRLIAKEVCPAQCSTEHLSKTLRKLTIRGSLDWKSLCQLRHIAQDKYGLEVEEISCVEETTTAHLDCIRHPDGLRAFMASRMFNLHSQTFISNPRAASSQAQEQLPSMIGIEHFVQLIHADVLHIGSHAFSSLKPNRKEISREERSSVEKNGAGDGARSETDAVFPSPKSRGDATMDAGGGDLDLSTSGDGIGENVRRVVSESVLASVEDASSVNDTVPWAFLPKLEDTRFRGSGQSLEVLTSERQGCLAPSHLSELVSTLRSFMAQKMDELRDLCSSSETRSIFSQTTQRWRNARKAVGHHYPVAQAEIVRKEVIALLKAGTLSLNPLHRLRFHIVDLGKAVSIIISLYHAKSRYRESTLAMLPRGFNNSSNVLSSFLSHLGVPQSVVEVGEEFEAAIDGLERTSIVREQYTAMLQTMGPDYNDVDLFKSLQYLYILAPALTLDHVESMRSLKGHYQGKGLVTSVTVTDDSFGIGLSYLLALLGQVGEFADLLWFDSAHKDYNMRLNRLEVGPDARGQGLNRGQRQNTEFQQALRTMESMQGTLDELRLLDHSMACAKLFFESLKPAETMKKHTSTPLP